MVWWSILHPQVLTWEQSSGFPDLKWTGCQILSSCHFRWSQHWWRPSSSDYPQHSSWPGGWWRGRLCSQGRGGDNFVSDCKLLLSGDGEHQDCLSSVSYLTQRRHMSRIVSLILTPGPGSAGEWELQAGITIRWDISFILNQFCNNFPWVDVPCTMCTNSSFSIVYTLYAYSHKPCLLWSFVVLVIKCKHTSYAGQKSLIRKRTKWFSIWTHQLQSMISQDLSTIMTQFLRRMKARLPRFQMMCDLYGVV